MAQNKGLTTGTNGTAQIAFGATGSDMLELFVKLCRGLDVQVIRADVDAIVKRAQNNAQTLADLFVLVFQTRDCRGGKGERDLFRALFLRLYDHFPETVVGALPLIVEYGYFKDFEGLYTTIAESDSAPKYAPLSMAIVRIVGDQLKADDDKVAAAIAEKMEPAGLSLAAKYAPRIARKKRKNAVHRVAFGHALRDYIFADAATGEVPANASELYRKLLSRVNDQLKTVERLMSTNRWEEIEFSRVPSLCLKRERKAFLFEDKNGALRDPKNEARIAFRRKLLKPENVKNIKGGQLFANDIVRSCMRQISSAEEHVLDAQWQDIVRATQKQIEDFAAQQNTASENGGGGGPSKPTFNLGNLVPLVDVSGSMSGTPMEVAIAMGLIVSQLAAPAFRNRVLTFESNPRWFEVKGDTIAQKVRHLMRAPWGGSTNFRAAMMLIIEALEAIAKQDRKMPDIPELIVFSDMQFDVAGARHWDTAYRTICKDFHELGARLQQAGVDLSEAVGPTGLLEPPTITFWNIYSSTTGLVAEADTKGVRLLSGFSQSLLKLLLSGALPEGTTVNEKGEKVRPDPLETLRAVIADERYDAVRTYLARATEGPFRDYDFVPQLHSEEDDEDDNDDAAPPALPQAHGGKK